VDPVKQARAAAAGQPDVVKRALVALAGGAEGVRGGSVRKGLQDAWGATGAAQLCGLIEGRYPFSAGSGNDIPLDDFGRLFAPGGLLDGFFNTQLRPYVDQGGSAWKPKEVGGVQPLTAEEVRQFQRAAVIRDLFFAAGGNQPTVRFDIKPVSADSGTRQVTLDFDGTSVVYAQGPTRPTQITWPGPNRMTNLRLVFDPAPSSGAPVLQAAGPWALFRLFGQGRLERGGGSELYALTFNLADRQVAYDIRAGSVQNPFAPGVLQDFRCPSLR
jgi:type VI secretion system protein ImpL